MSTSTYSSKHTGIIPEKAGGIRPAWQQERPKSKRLSTLCLSIIAALSILLVFAGLHIIRNMSESTITTAGYYGKTLTASNYTVVQGIFVQSDPDFKDADYDVLGDSFGLIDKSHDRWIKFEQSVWSSQALYTICTYVC